MSVKTRVKVEFWMMVDGGHFAESETMDFVRKQSNQVARDAALKVVQAAKDNHRIELSVANISEPTLSFQPDVPPVRA